MSQALRYLTGELGYAHLPMIEDIRTLIAAKPFVPFFIHTASGTRLRVPTVNHASVPPAGSPVFVFSDGGGYQTVPLATIASVTVEREETVASE